jgi:hypothetical protein
MLAHTARSLLGRNHREINKKQQTSTTEEQVQHQAIGSGAGNRGTTKPKEIMMIKDTWMQPYLAYMI